MMELLSEIKRLKKELKATIAAHYYQKDEVFYAADFTGDSLELAKKAAADENPLLIFCGVGFMAQSVKILSPEKKVYMPKIACCSMARMIDDDSYDASMRFLAEHGVAAEDVVPVAYINTNADVKAKIGKADGFICTSSSAEKIMLEAKKSGKKILFVPDRCLGVNTATKVGLSSCVIGDKTEPKEVDVICFDGFCSIHQLFEPSETRFYRNKYPGIVIAVHPECRPEVVKMADFVGSTSQIIKYVASLAPEQKVAVGTEFNLVNRLREANTFVLSSTKPECPTMNETTLQDLYDLLKAIADDKPYNEITVETETAKWAKIALDKMLRA